MARRRTQLLLALAAIAVFAGGAIAGVAIAGGRAAPAGASRSGPKPAARATVPTITAPIAPPTCFVAGRLVPGQTCSIHPCVEFVEPRLPVPQPRAPVAQPRAPVAQPRRALRPRMACAMYPSPRGQVVPIGR